MSDEDVEAIESPDGDNHTENDAENDTETDEQDRLARERAAARVRDAGSSMRALPGAVVSILDRRQRLALLISTLCAVGAAVADTALAASVVPVTQCVRGECPAWIGGARDGAALATAVALTASVMIARALAQISAVTTAARLQQHVQRTLVARLFDGYLHLPWRDFTSRGQAHYLRRCMTTALDAAWVIRQLLTIVGSLCTLTLLSVLLLIQQPTTALASLGAIGLVGLIVITAIGRRQRRASHIREESLRAWTTTAGEALSSFKEIRAHQREEMFTDRVAPSLRELGRVNAQMSYLPEMPRLILDFLVVVAVVSVAGWWFLADRDGAALVEALIFFAIVARAFIPALSSLLSTRSVLAGSILNIELIRDELATIDRARQERIVLPVVPAEADALVLDDVHLGHDGGPVILDGASLRLPLPGWTAVVGPSGVGKTSVIEAVCGLLPVTSGRVRLEWSRERPPVLAYVPQHVALLDGTLAENVHFGEPEDAALLGAVLRRSGLTEVVAGLPQGTSTRLGPNGVTLSGGQRQRLAIARALYRRPDLLVLDEATSGLDEAMERQVLEAVRTEMPDTSVLFVTHRPSTLGLADRLVRVSAGRLEESGAPG